MSTLDRQPADLASLVRGDRMFSHDAKGDAIARERTCECGRKFTQVLLSERFLTIVEKHSRRAMDLFLKQVPGFYVPVHCPACERSELGRVARRVEMNRAALEYQPDMTHEPHHEPEAAD